MGSEDEIREFEKGAVLGERFGLVDVEPRRRDFAALEGGDERALLDAAAARAVEYAHALFHHLKGLFVYHVLGSLG